jgi:hypothetical protein
VRVEFEDSKSQRTRSFSGPVSLLTFGSEQYVWKDDGANSHADPDGPPVGATIARSAQRNFTLPKASITVLRGRVEGID